MLSAWNLGAKWALKFAQNASEMAPYAGSALS